MRYATNNKAPGIHASTRERRDQKNDRPDVLVNHFVHGKARGFAYESIRHFIDNLVTGGEFLVSLEDAVNTSLVILAIMESAETGRPVKVKYLDS